MHDFLLRRMPCTCFLSHARLDAIDAVSACAAIRHTETHPQSIPTATRG
eukprot:COSAG03_NODE_7995_length_848_cov_1.010681_1_plen_48_part_01